MALTQISTQGIKDGTISSTDLADQSVTLAKLPHGTSSNDGKFLRANNGADPTFETVSSIGGGTGVDFDDNVKVRFGTGNDLEIFHNGTHSVIQNNTGTLFTLADNLIFKNNANNETLITATANGSVELYHDNSKKLETNSEGVKISGFLEMEDNQRIQMGTGDDLQIYHDGSDSYLKDAGTGHLNITSSQVNIINAAVNESMAKFIQDGGVELYFNGNKKLATTSNGIKLDDDTRIGLGNSEDLQIFHNGSHSFIKNSGTGVLHIQGNNSNDLKISPRDDEDSIIAKNNGAVELYHDNSKKFETTSGGATVNGTLSFPDGDSGFSVEGGIKLGNSGDFHIYHDGANSYLKENGTGDLVIVGKNNIKFLDFGTNETMCKMVSEGAVELYHDNIKMIETTSTGTSMPDGKFAKFGNSDDITMGHNTENFITYTGASLRVTGDGINDIQLMPVSNERSARFLPNGAVELYHNNSKKLETTSTGVSITGTLNVNTIKNTSGGSSSTPEQIEQGRLKAYVKINAVSGTFVRQSFGVSSVTDSGTGNYTVNFSTAFANDEYIYCLGSTNTNHSRGGVALQEGKSTTTCDLFGTSMGNNGRFDVEVHCGFYGD